MPARMIDVGSKAETDRVAVASGEIQMAASTLRRIADGRVPKGDVLEVARVAAIQAAKKTPDLLPLCHPIRLTRVDVELRPDARRRSVRVRATAQARDRTGVEMEALTAVAAATLTIYDMCKALDRGMTISEIRLESKRGGRSGTWTRARGRPAAR